MITTKSAFSTLVSTVLEQDGGASPNRSLVQDLLRSHALTCRGQLCPFHPDGRPLVVTRRFEPECDGPGGWSHRNLYGPIGWIGEHMVHLAIPEICLHSDEGYWTAPMDADSPRGEAEIKTATTYAQANGGSRAAFSVRASQRRDHALPLTCVRLSGRFLKAFRGRRVAFPHDTAEIAEHIEAVFTIPLPAFPSPSTFIVPDTPSRDWRIRAIQRLFRFDYSGLCDLGLQGLCRIRAIYDEPSKVEIALKYVEALGDRLDARNIQAYRSDPHRLLAEAEAYASGVAISEMVEEALALSTLRRCDRRRNRARLEAESESERQRRELQARQESLLRLELPFALLGMLTYAAGRPISALEMRHRYGLRRDTYFPPDFGAQARERGIAVCGKGERRRIRSADGVRERTLTPAERGEMGRQIRDWSRLISAFSDHPAASHVLACWRDAAAGDPIARKALDLLDEHNSKGEPVRLRLVGTGASECA